MNDQNLAPELELCHIAVADGPDKVHRMVIARRELNHWAKQAEAVGAPA